MNDSVIAIIKTLLSKGIAFCAYRFPGTEAIRLAVLPDNLPHEPKKFFCFAPFTARSKVNEIVFNVVDPDYINATFEEQLAAMPVQNLAFRELPEASTKEAYFKQFGHIFKQLQEGKLRKAILSRVIITDKTENFDVVDFFQVIHNAYTRACVHLMYHPDAGMWMGATPELLINKRDELLSIMAVAGTQPFREDQVYTWREKEQEEHALVGRHIEQVAQNFRCQLDAQKGPYTVAAGSVVHLRTDYVYRIDEAITIQALVSQLHPTPAIAGLPVDASLDIIYGTEPYDREYYCGYLGETDNHTFAQFFVNLRCMHIGKNSIAVFVGGGLTVDSEVEEEWLETEQKSKTLIDKIKIAEVI